MEKNEVSVIGAGTMGSGIAQLLAQRDISVNLVDRDQSILELAKENIKKQLDLFMEQGIIDENRAVTALDRIRLSVDLESLKNSWLVIEAVPEKLQLKQQIFRQLEQACDHSVIFATNTSGISINEIGSNLNYPERFIGTHFFMPATIIPLVEVIKGNKTSQETIDKMMNFLKEAGKYPVLIRHDIPGFIGNRIQHAIAREAISLLEKGVATAQDIDAVVCWSLGVRLLFTGPLEQRDLNGLDIHNDIASYLYEDLENRTDPSPLLSSKVANGELGLKTGKGFYNWEGVESSTVNKKKNLELLELIKWLGARQ